MAWASLRNEKTNAFVSVQGSSVCQQAILTWQQMTPL